MRSSLLVLCMLLLTGCAALASGPGETQAVATVYKSPSCGCCVGWSSHMEQNGYGTKTVLMEDLSPIKQQYNIPASMGSCHTAIIGGYFVEGHVPSEVIDKLLAEQPDIDGIALPRMPPGSPGMPGQKSGEWVIYAIKDGEVSEYTRI